MPDQSAPDTKQPGRSIDDLAAVRFIELIGSSSWASVMSDTIATQYGS
jgi:hypothetical protein